MLRYLHSSGRVMWHEDPELIGRVIIKPIHFVEQATRIIRKHRKDCAASPYDTTEHKLALSEDVQQLVDTKYRREWRAMVDSGEAATDLLYLLLTAWDARDIKYIQNRMNNNNNNRYIYIYLYLSIYVNHFLNFIEINFFFNSYVFLFHLCMYINMLLYKMSKIKFVYIFINICV